jgi:hypothetical protein
MELTKESLPALAIAALLGTTGGGGVSTFLSNNHTHPAIIKEIREVQYENVVEQAKLVMAATPDHESPDYVIAAAQLTKYTEKLADLQ